jgi:hypothetical protein
MKTKSIPSIKQATLQAFQSLPDEFRGNDLVRNNKGTKYFIKPGQRFGRLVVIREVSGFDYRGIKERRVLCFCDCGNYIETRVTSIFKATKSCGCFRKENSASLLRIHDLYRDPAFQVFKRIRQRCLYKKNHNYPNWGGRGITICDEWKNNPKLFVEWAYKNGYKKELTIERLDNNEGYSPENCVFADRVRQANNRRTNRIIEYNGESLSMADFCRKWNLCYSTFEQRIRLTKTSIEKAMINCGHYKPMNQTDKLNYRLGAERAESLYVKL